MVFFFINYKLHYFIKIIATSATMAVSSQSELSADVQAFIDDLLEPSSEVWHTLDSLNQTVGTVLRFQDLTLESLSEEQAQHERTLRTKADE